MACVPESASVKQPRGLSHYLLSMLLLLSCQQTEKRAAAGGESGNKWDGLKVVYCPSPENCNTWHTRWHYCNFYFFFLTSWCFSPIITLHPDCFCWGQYWHKLDCCNIWRIYKYILLYSTYTHLILKIFLGEDLLLQSIIHVTDIFFDNENKKPYCTEKSH